MSHGPNGNEMDRRAAAYVATILKAPTPLISLLRTSSW
jgi:hypothetical protein